MNSADDFKIQSGTLDAYTGTDTDVVVPEGVKRIWRAFEMNKKITSVVLPSSIKAIPSDTFMSCSNLTSVSLPAGLTSIGKQAFFRCEKLTSVSMGDNIQVIEEAAFTTCTALASITLPKKLKKLAVRLFAHCSSLTSVTLPEKLESVEREAFYDCTALPSITLPKGLMGIGYGAFSYCRGLKSIEIPESVNTVREYAFLGCKSLSSVKLPNELRSLDSFAFSGCSALKDVELPYSLTRIEEGLFLSCTSLTSITIPQSITIIKKDAFKGCTGLKTICYQGDEASWSAIPKATAGIPADTVVVFTEAPERESDGFISAGGTLKKYVGKKHKLTLPTALLSIGKRAFEGCPTVTSVTVSGGLKSIGEEAFTGSCITEICFEGGVEIIESGAFRGCRALTSLKFPYGLKRIGAFAFAECDSLTSISLPSDIEELDANAFTGCKGLTDVYYNDYQSQWDALGCTLPEGITLHCRERTYYVTTERLGYMKLRESQFAPEANKLLDCLLKIEGTETSSYDNSDDDRASCSSSSSKFVTYRRIDPYKDSEALLWSDGGKICGIVFRIKSGSKTTPYAFLFESKESSSLRLGYSASHSSSYTYIERVTLVKKGENGAPNEARSLSFERSETDPDI